MIKWLFFVCLLVVSQQLIISDCLYVGDSCFGDERPGTCRLLSDCAPLLREIQNAGSPIPVHLRRRLLSLSCGFQANEPIVCCVPPFTNPGNEVTETTHNWFPPTSHSMGVTNPPRDDNNWSNGNTKNPPRDGNTWGNNSPNTNDNRNPTPTQTSSVSNNNKPAIPDIERHRNLSLLPNDCGIVDEDKIWGGNRTRLYEMPWMVLLSYDSARGTKLSCGGTLITERYVLTAAHCVSNLGDRLRLTGVLLGEHDVRQDPDCERIEGELHCAPNVRNSPIERVITHPGYRPPRLNDDIALLRLSQPADFSLDNMKPICLPTTMELQSEKLDGSNGIVAGWGATEDGLQSPVLLSVSLPIVNNKDCQDAYNGSPQILESQLCAGGVEERDSCGGDSGGPLVYPGRTRNSGVRHVQRGIVSYGAKRCGIGGFPGVYTRVGYYMDWILDNLSN